jgi:membrane associated rhomboid family serine protease
VVIAIIAANALAFLFELQLGRALAPFLTEFGVVPARVTAPGEPLGGVVTPLVTAMFLHGGWLHVIGNMLFLWVFGDNVEDRLGHIGFLAFYLLTGVAANVAHVLINPASTVPTIGASGAVAGVLGAYILFFPGARVVTLVPVGFFLQVVELPAFLFLGIWFLIQFASGFFSLGTGMGRSGGVAWWAHVGGFAAGFLLAVPARLRAGLAPRA